MAVQDENGGSPSASVFQSDNSISLSVKLKDQYSCGNDFSPKVRKPYTITKQRERWTEEEHRKFLEALKLYGRAWRKIEEHVGTKTAVQIRSHAQKFFYKVTRDPNGSSTNTEEPVEIPPPRPKRKPMHPYPRKFVQSANKETSVAEHSTRSYLSLSEQENQSPKSVLSAMGSETMGSSGSNTPDGSLSPVSSAADNQDRSLIRSLSNSSAEDSGSPPAVIEAAVSTPDQLSVKLELLSQDNAYAKKSSAEEASAQSLKLFGRTVLVTGSHRPSSPAMETCKPLPSDEHEKRPVQPLPLRVMTMESSTENAHWGHLPHAVQALYLVHFQNENSNLGGSGSATPMPLWPFFGGLPFPVNNQDPVKGSLYSNLGKDQEKEAHEKGSWTASNAESLNCAENCDKYLDIDTQSRYSFLEKKEKEPEPVFKLKPSSRSAFSQLRISTEKCKRGFVSYKRTVTEGETKSSTITSEERAEKRIHLCL